MADYRLPMDADGVKYHGTVDQNEENPGHFMYGLDENGNKRIIRTDEQGNVLTRVTGSNVEDGNPIPVKSTRRIINVASAENIEIAPGGAYYLTNVLEVKDFSEFALTLRWVTNPEDYDLKAVYFHNQSANFVTAEDTFFREDLGSYKAIKSVFFRVYVRNKGSDKATLKSFVLTGR